jgi:hypothetical protein
MMENGLLVVSHSGAYREQGFLQWLQEQGIPVCLIDAHGWEGTSCYCSPEASKAIGEALPKELPPVRWIDSGDYHYMSYLLSLREKEPFSLVLLDHHPDDQDPAFGPVLSCGSWVKWARQENPMLEDVLTIGPEGCPQDIPEGWLEGRGRLYVSLDKDIMSKEWARTGWSQGEHTLPKVLDILRRLAGTGKVVALDICGELTESQGARGEDLRINKETNIELYKFTTTYLKQY